MATQESKNTGSQSREVDEVDETPLPTQQSSVDITQQTAGTDDLLDEIDGVLEVNAEEFVRGFVQKGGQ
ncbi:ubiquitin-like protein Pup [Arthrobacter roseus]|uniref:ubiquitin-like protein Pup n=1 Tax=Arthrobacter roseus TaxID=136274 RepID=UPI00196456D3|nr:ubiquitin-like protein Pup [Arthrobacter roseus]MBM7848554.1 ubiquitin-like protein Pup [Arthrobacter roseus]